MNSFRILFVLAVLVAFTIIKSALGVKGFRCPPLPYFSLPNGTIFVVSPDKVRFQCDKGYFLGGPQQIRCRNGRWTSNRPPTCYRTEGRCDPPPAISNGTIFGEDYLYGSTVQYICDSGYLLLGEGRRTCLESEAWSGITPACISESEPLQDVANRLEKKFLTKMNSYSSDSVIQARYLDSESIVKGLELVILIDRSSSVDPVDLERAKDFVKFLFKEFKVKNGENPTGARVAVITFGSKAEMIFNLNNATINNFAAASRTLDDKLQAEGGGTAMVPAFILVFQHIMELLRDDSKRALFLISDGDPNEGGNQEDASSMADNLKQYGEFEIFAVGIGSDINRQLLTRIASKPIIDHVFLLKNYNNLDEILRIMKNQQPEVPPPAPGKCGHFDTGVPPDATRPWEVAIYVPQPVPNKNESKLNFCGGVLICSQWVLTAASCFYNVQKDFINLELQNVFIVLGEKNLFKIDSKEMSFYAEDVIIHPNFIPQKSFYNNLALIKLNSPAPVRIYRPICLPHTDKLVPLYSSPEVNASLSGWGKYVPKGKPDILSPATTRFILRTESATLTQDNECHRSSGRKIQGKSIFCASSGLETCLGNIGSPVFGSDTDKGIYHILGILSQRANCKTGFSQYTELIKFVPWINEVSKKCHFKHWN